MAAWSIKQRARTSRFLEVVSLIVLPVSVWSAVPYPSSSGASKDLMYQLRGAEYHTYASGGVKHKGDLTDDIAEAAIQANLTTIGDNNPNISTASLVQSGPPYRAYTTCGTYESGMPWDVSGGVPVVPFLGIRYASPMNSSLRWKSPVEPVCQVGQLLAASEWGSVCIQLDGKQRCV